MQIRIKSYTFTLSEPFQQGTIITKGEAQAMNNLRAENIQNNLRKHVNDAVAALGKDDLLAPEVLADLRAKFAEADRTYKFLEKHSPKERLGDIEEEARTVARERVEAAFRQSGEELPSTDLLELMIKDQAKLPSIEEEARLRVSARRRAVGAGLDSL